jgi:hypothetical protein
MNAQHTHDTWTGKVTSSDQGLIYSEQTGRNIAVCYDPKHTALIAAAPELLENLRQLCELLESIGHDCTPSREAIAKANEVQA